MSSVTRYVNSFVIWVKKARREVCRLGCWVGRGWLKAGLATGCDTGNWRQERGERRERGKERRERGKRGEKGGEEREKRGDCRRQERGKKGRKGKEKGEEKEKNEKKEKNEWDEPAPEVPYPPLVVSTRPRFAISARAGAMGTRWGVWAREAELTLAMGLAWGVIYYGPRCENWAYNASYMPKSAQNQAKMRYFSRLFSTQIQPYSTCGTSIWPHDDSREH